MTRSSVQIYISLNEVRIFFRSIDEISHISFNMMFIFFTVIFEIYMLYINLYFIALFILFIDVIFFHT